MYSLFHSPAHVCMYVRTHVLTYVYACVYVFVYAVCMRLCVCVCVWYGVYRSTSTSISASIFMSVSMSMQACMYVCMHVCRLSGIGFGVGGGGRTHHPTSAGHRGRGSRYLRPQKLRCLRPQNSHLRQVRDHGCQNATAAARTARPRGVSSSRRGCWRVADGPVGSRRGLRQRHHTVRH